jgi:hypothetical protein
MTKLAAPSTKAKKDGKTYRSVKKNRNVLEVLVRPYVALNKKYCSWWH